MSGQRPLEHVGPPRSSPSLRVTIQKTHRGRGAPFELDVDLTFKPGITILFGPSGSGKSTILQAIAGIAMPDRGRVSLGDEVWFDAGQRTNMPVEKRHVAYVFQSLALFPHMTAIGNVAYGIDRAKPRDERAERARQLLDRCGVAHLAERRPKTFSGGEAQRVALARALAMAPRVVLLDEPFSALDRDLRIQLASVVRDLVDELQVPMAYVTHNHGEAKSLGDEVIRMQRGRVAARGSYEEVLGDHRGNHTGSRFDDIGKTPAPELIGERD